uniref:Reverse transcriptase zinc-binding domain-containing protein n=1 Tax=Cannabis sativa TaxID=3483 RepID=A0A803PHC3_CANSA
MATYLFPKTLCYEMDQAVQKFWWMGNESKDRFLALCDWNSLCLPLDRGALNFKKFGDINLALVAKLGWKLAKEEDSLWCKVFKAKYWENRDQAFRTSNVSRNASFGAKGIMATRDLIRNEACWILADGSKVDLWASPWIPWLDWDKSRAAFNPLCVPNPMKVSTLIGADGEWIASSVQRWFVPSVASSLHLIKRLPSSQDDLLGWKDATNGMFSPSVAYKSIIKRRWGETDQLWLRIWKLQITERLKMLLWKLCRDIIPFGNRLQRIFGNSTRCVICGEADDSAQHLFFKCPLAKAVWFASRWAIRSDSLNFGAPRDMVEWLLSPKFLQGADGDDLGILAKVISAAACLRTTWESPSIVGGSQNSPTAIYTGKPVLLVDAAFKDLRAAAGIVVAVSEGNVSEAMAVCFEANQPLEAESLALVNAVKWCNLRGWKQIVIASDCQALVHGLHARRAPNSQLAGVFWLLVELLDALLEVEIVWTPCVDVLAAHKLAKWAFSNYFSSFLSAEDLAPLVAM